MNSNRREVMPTDEDDPLVTALQQWADKPVGILSGDLHSQVVNRLAEPRTIVEGRQASLIICVLLLCSTVVGWWLFLGNGNVENVAGRDVIGEEQPSAQTITANPISEGDLANSESHMKVGAQAPAGLQEIQQQLESLRALLQIGQIGASFSEMEQQCRQLKERVELQERKFALAEVKQGVITDWLANQ